MRVRITGISSIDVKVHTDISYCRPTLQDFRRSSCDTFPVISEQAKGLFASLAKNISHRWRFGASDLGGLRFELPRTSQWHRTIGATKSSTNMQRMRLFADSWKLPAYGGAFLLTIDNFSFFTYNWSFFAYSFSFFTYNWSFFAYNGKVRPIRALRDCKQRSFKCKQKSSNSK